MFCLLKKGREKGKVEAIKTTEKKKGMRRDSAFLKTARQIQF